MVGVLKLKEFAVKYVRDGRKEISAVEIMKSTTNMLTVYSDTNILEMLMLFQAKSTRIALVCSLKKKTDPRIESIMYSVILVLLRKAIWSTATQETKKLKSLESYFFIKSLNS